MRPFVVLGVLALAACGGERGGRDALRVVRVEPDSGLVFLNQQIELRFDRRVDPISVTKDTVRIVDEAGDAVPVERIRVLGASVVILPRVPLEPGLADGSFRPGRRYTLELAGFPRSNAIRGARGELLLEAPRPSWRAVDEETRPADKPSLLLPSADIGRFQLLRPPVADAGGEWIELFFNRPVYPPSALPAAFVLKPMHEQGINVPIESVRILRRDAPGGVGSVVQLSFSMPLRSGAYQLYFPPGSALHDYRLNRAWIPPDPSRAGWWQELGLYFWPVQVVRGGVRAIVTERFTEDRRALTGDPEDKGLGLGEIEGALEWRAGGLRLPALGYGGFSSLGELAPPAATRDLQPGATREIAAGRSVKLPAEVWDFDRVRIPPGQTYIVLHPTRPLRIRIAGALEIDGDLIVRVAGPAQPGARPRAPVAGDPRPSWESVSGRLAIEVGGLARLRGRILRQDGRGDPSRQLVPGYVWSRGPFLGAWERSALQPWQRPLPASAEAVEPSVLLPGRWAAVSPWYELPEPMLFEGRFVASGADADVRILVQGREALPGGRRHTWVRPEVLPSLGRLGAIRFAVTVRDRRDTGEVVLESLRIR